MKIDSHAPQSDPGLFKRKAVYPKGTPLGFFKRKFLECGRPDPEAPWYYKFKIRGRQYPCNCQTPRIDLAKREAKAHRERVTEAVRSGNWTPVDRTKVRSEMATIGEVCAAHVAWPTMKPRPKVRKQYCDRLKWVVSIALPGRNVDDVRTSELTEKVARACVEHQRTRVGTVCKRYPGSTPKIFDVHSVTMSTASTLRQARAVFSRKALNYYSEQGLKVADVSGFMKHYVEQPTRELPSAPPMEALRALLASGPELLAKDPQAYVAFLLIAELGMRPSEIAATREGWMEKDGETWVMSIIKRPDEGFDPKHTQGHMAMSAELHDQLEQFKHLRTDGYLVPGATWTERRDDVFRRLSAWCKKFLPDFEKATYELRRYAGSRVLDVTGNLVDTQRFLRHRDIKTTMEWYAYRMQRAAALPMAVRVA